MKSMIPFVLAAAIGTAAAQTPQAPGERDYRACLALLKTKPDEAFESALAWRDNGGGPPAQHCAALALVELRQYGEAATRLEKLAEDLQAGGSALLPMVLSQAGNAWLLADRPDRAYGAFTAGLALAPDNVDLLIDRARTLASRSNWAEALRDADHALRVKPDSGESYALRAAAFRHTGNMERALEDAEMALALDPDATDALFERGALRLEAGDLKGARADFVKVRLLEQNSPLAEAAGQAIEQMDVKKN